MSESGAARSSPEFLAPLRSDAVRFRGFGKALTESAPDLSPWQPLGLHFSDHERYPRGRPARKPAPPLCQKIRTRWVEQPGNGRRTRDRKPGHGVTIVDLPQL